MTAPKVDRDRLMGELFELAKFSADNPPGTTRVVYTEPDLKARAWLRAKCESAGLSVREDAVGNLFARWGDAGVPAIGTGSHIDAIPNSGIYDGTVGVLGGLEAIRALKESGFEPARPIELLMFTSEEPTRFGIGCLGSRLLSGTIAIDRVDALKDSDGGGVRAASREAGFSGELESVKLDSDYYAGFVELHIEQGPLLEKNCEKIGVVTAIAAPASLRVTFDGAGGHAGTVLMRERRDALVGAAELAIAVEAAALSSTSADTVATTGVFTPFPGAVNSIPSKCKMEIDVRDTAEKTRDLAVEKIRNAAGKIARHRFLDLHIEMVNADPPAQCSTEICDAIASAAEAERFSHRRMASRAYHDSLFMARVAPVAMIFIPCRDGVSHRPDEFSTPEDIAAGAVVLAKTLAALAAK